MPTVGDINKFCPWVLEAMGLVGQREVPGKVTAPFIRVMLQGLHAWWTDDETPWCGVLVSWCLQEAQVLPPKAFYRAAAFKAWGVSADTPLGFTYGAVAVIKRPGGFHVGFVTGHDIGHGKVRVLGGNQGNMVKESYFPQADVVAVRYPGVPEHWDGRSYLSATDWAWKAGPTSQERMV